MINGSILPQPKIIGGKEVPYGKWPFIAFTAGQSLCAATLIHSDVLLSAAHCNQAFDEGVFIGGIYLNEIDGTFHAVADRLVHPNYSGDELYEPINDIMLVKIAIPSTETPVTLARFSGQPAEGSVVTVAGYGLTTEGGDVSDTLLETQMFVSNTDDCLYLYELDASISPKIFCTLEDNRDTCQGDSGG
jgi:trypsin